jgi:hypothetical protein
VFGLLLLLFFLTLLPCCVLSRLCSAQRNDHLDVVEFLQARGAENAGASGAKKSKSQAETTVIYPYYSDPVHGERYFISIIDFLSRYTARFVHLRLSLPLSLSLSPVLSFIF